MHNFNRHLELEGSHAFLSASKYHWLNYDDDKFDATYKTQLAAQHGSRLHDFAKIAIELKNKLEDTQQTLNMYVNDAIGFMMIPEQTLFYSYNAYGTADAVSFRKNIETNRMLLRIHDLKTGTTPASMKQLLIYVAFFCLEYEQSPFEIDMVLRIYQNDAIEEFIPQADDIFPVIDKIITFDRRIEEMKAEVRNGRL